VAENMGTVEKPGSGQLFELQDSNRERQNSMYMQQRVSSKRQSWLYSFLAIVLLPCIVSACGFTHTSRPSSAQGVPDNGKQQSGQDSMAPFTSPRTGQTLYVSYASPNGSIGATTDPEKMPATILVAALHVSNGQKIWQQTITQKSHARSASLLREVGGIVYVVTLDQGGSLLTALDAKSNGKKLWQIEENKEGGIYSLVVLNDIVYIRVGNTDVQALEAKSGKQLWTYSSKDYTLDMNMRVTKNALYIAQQKLNGGDARHFLVKALRLTDGKEIWSTSFTPRNISLYLLMTATDKIVYVVLPNDDNASKPGRLIALRAGDGLQLWSVGNISYALPVVFDDVLYLAIYQHLSALNASNGKQIWSRTTNFAMTYVLPGYGIYGLGSGKESFCSINPQSGKNRWCSSRVVPGLILSSNITMNPNIVYVITATHDFKLSDIYALDQNTGDELHHYNIGDQGGKALLQSIAVGE